MFVVPSSTSRARQRVVQLSFLCRHSTASRGHCFLFGSRGHFGGSRGCKRPQARCHNRAPSTGAFRPKFNSRETGCQQAGGFRKYIDASEQLATCSCASRVPDATSVSHACQALLGGQGARVHSMFICCAYHVRMSMLHVASCRIYGRWEQLFMKRWRAAVPTPLLKRTPRRRARNPIPGSATRRLRLRSRGCARLCLRAYHGTGTIGQQHMTC